VPSCFICAYSGFSIFNSLFFFLFIPPLPRSTLFPYTTLFRSLDGDDVPGTSARMVLADFPLACRFQAHVRGIRLCRGRGEGESRSEEHTSELQSPDHLVCRLLLEKKNINEINDNIII